MTTVLFLFSSDKSQIFLYLFVGYFLFLLCSFCFASAWFSSWWKCYVDVRHEASSPTGCQRRGHLARAQTTSQYDGWGGLCVFVCVCIRGGVCGGVGGLQRSVDGPHGLTSQTNGAFQKEGGKTPIDRFHTHTHTEKKRIWWPNVPVGERESNLFSNVSVRDGNIVIPLENKFNRR